MNNKPPILKIICLAGIAIALFVSTCNSPTPYTKGPTASTSTDGASILYDLDRKCVLMIHSFRDVENQVHTSEGGELGGNVKTELLGLTATNATITVSEDLIDVAFMEKADPILRFTATNERERTISKYDLHFNKGPKPAHLYINIKSKRPIDKLFSYKDIIAICKTSNQRIGVI